MNELEKKLNELGYDFDEVRSWFTKQVSKDTIVYFILGKYNSSIYAWGVESQGNDISTKEHIYNSKKATNMLQEDLGKLLNFATISINEECKAVDVPREWYEQEIKRLHIENEKLKKLVDILLEREMRSK